MTTVTTNFGTLDPLTVTNLHSLGDGAYWQSGAIDNGTIKGLWAEVFVTILTTTTAGSATGFFELYYAGSVDGGTDFAGGATGTEGTYANTGNLDIDDTDIIDRMKVDASETTARTYRKRMVIDQLSEDFVLLLLNASGTANGATVNAVEIRIHKYDSA